jgi:hypothetical protein
MPRYRTDEAVEKVDRLPGPRNWHTLVPSLALVQWRRVFAAGATVPTSNIALRNTVQSADKRAH